MMKKAFFFSLMGHFIFLFLLIFGLPYRSSSSSPEGRPLILDFVRIGEISQAPLLSPHTSQKPSPSSGNKSSSLPEKSKDSPRPSPPTPAPMTAEDPLPQKATFIPKDTSPERPSQDSLPEAKKKSVLPKKEEVKKKVPPQKPKESHPKKQEKTKNKRDEVNLDPEKKEKKSLNKEKKKNPKVKEEQKKDPIKKTKGQSSPSLDALLDETLDTVSQEPPSGNLTDQSTDETAGAPADQLGDVITGTEIDAVRRQIMKCWVLPNGGRDIQDLVVDLEMSLSQDGTVLKAKVVNSHRTDARFRAAAESARRAVLNPECNPLPLNPEKYEQWKTLEMSFRPQDAG